MKKISHLILNRDPLAQIDTKTKRIEHRDYTPYWGTWLEGPMDDVIQFLNGYASKAQDMIVEYRGYRIRSKARNKPFAICPGCILKIKRWKP